MLQQNATRVKPSELYSLNKVDSKSVIVEDTSRANDDNETTFSVGGTDRMTWSAHALYQYCEKRTSNYDCIEITQ